MTEKPFGIERRQHPRAPIGIIVRVLTAEGARHFYSKDISMGGIFLMADQPLLEETHISLEIYLPLVSMPVRVNGEVVWLQRQAPSGFAVKFTNITEGAQKLIRWVVERYLGRQAVK